MAPFKARRPHEGFAGLPSSSRGAQDRKTISMLTPSGTWMRMSWRRARSSASRSMSRLWIRISHRSQVSLPSPSGDLRTGTTRRFVGSGIGPAIATPVRSLISLICWHTLSTFFGSVPLSEIRAFWAIGQPGETDLAVVRSLRLLDVDDLARRDGLTHIPDREATHLRNCLKASITSGFVGRIFTRAASPVLRKSGFSGFGAPVFGSRAAMISSKVHATWAVWAWKTGVYPAVMTLG